MPHMHSESKLTHLYIWISENKPLIYNPTGPPYFKNRRNFLLKEASLFKKRFIEEIGLIQV